MGRRQRMKPPDQPPFPGDSVTLRVEGIVFGGAAIAHLPDGRVVFVSYAAPGELVEAAVERVHPDYIEAVTTRVIEGSPERVEPPCPIFGECGGCQLQHMTYPSQLAAKELVVREQLRRIGRLDGDVVRTAVGAEQPWGYRNHVRFSTGKKYGDVGFISRRGRGLLKVECCPIADPWVNEVLPKLQGKGSGLHQVQVRHSQETGSWLISPEVPGLEMPSGQKWYEEELGEHRFRVSASAFFQVNHAQAETMTRLVGESLPHDGKLLVDAFAGVGTFAKIFASRFERVIAIEESHSAAKDAVVNLEGVENVELRVGKVEDVLPLLQSAPDAILLDPPRPGCAPEVLDAIARFRPTVVVYVSCNPATLARDLRVLVDAGYTLDHVTPLDMFPQTGHIECVSRLSLADLGAGR
ncbi:MAG TPA: class I SAM-dependent RNA methyltransferase [Tepidiformaceae bacterium]|nr:class I SAM-dependent RNA methyltransferase [Tepidiformaceae bacterium]